MFFLKQKKVKKQNFYINFKGDRKLRDRRLRDIITSQEAQFWKVLTKNIYLNQTNIELDKRLLTNYYKYWYYDVKVLSEIAELMKILALT